MNKGLNVLDLYADAGEGNINRFNSKLSSVMDVDIESNKPKTKTEWLDIMELTIPYLENILKAPIRAIINEEEVVPIEKIKKVSVESIKHLSKNSNFIDDIDENGDVQPGKLLFVFKEETFNTYENRFIFTLIQKMRIILKKEKDRLLNSTSKFSEFKKIDYSGRSYLAKNKIDISLVLTSSTDSSGRTFEQDQEIERMKILEKNIFALELSDTYKTLEKLRVPLVKPPINKTNVLLKNVNFQYAVKLWDFLMDEMDKKDQVDEVESTSKKYKDKGKLRKYLDETFLLDYLVMQCADNPDFRVKHNKEILEQLIANVVERTIDVDASLTEEQLKNLVGKQFKIIKYKATTSNKEIQDIFKNHINKYVQKIVRFEKEG